MIDGYLKLLDADGTFIAGESPDDILRNWISISEFSMGDGTGATSDDEEDDTTSKKKAKAEALAAKAQGLSSTKKGREVAKLSSSLLADLKTEKQQEEADKEEETSKKGQKLTFTVTKELDTASPDLFLAYCRTMAHKRPRSEADNKVNQFHSAIVDLRKMFAGQPRPFMVCTFWDVTLMSYKLDYDSGSSLFTETVQFKFGMYQVEYKMQSAEGVTGKAKIVEGSLPGNDADLE